MNSDEICLCVCSTETANELKLPSDVTVITDLIPDNEVYTISKEDFMAFIEEYGYKAVRRRS